ncbi:hypothetical protein AGMMS50268_09510 [Spirochaetia bacterium]|nr:hypothetical protein AGMMS50268_09510 [Spirochaetia bacterium]
MQELDEQEGQENEFVDGEDDSGISFAEQEFINYCEANGLDYEEAAMDEDEAKDFRKIKRHFTRAVDEKRITVDGTALIYTVSNRSPKTAAGKTLAGSQFTIRRPNGRAMLAMDGYKDTQQMNKLEAYMAAICGIEKRDIGMIAALDKTDHQLIQDIAILFLTD